MATKSSTEGILADLNRESFLAENAPKTARQALAPVLADDFYIVRRTGAMQDKEKMLDAAEKDTSGRVRSIENETRDVSIRVYGNAAVARTVLTVHESGGTLFGRFLNTKVFIKQEGDWKLAAWQVTQVEKTA